MLHAMRSWCVVAVSWLLACNAGCNAVLGLDERERAGGAAGDGATPLPDGSATDAIGLDTEGFDASGIDASGVDGAVDVPTVDTTATDTTPPTWCESEPAHTYCEDFDRGHVLAFVETGGGKASVGAPAKSLPKALGCTVVASSAASGAVLPIPASSSSRTPKVGVDVLFDPVGFTTDGDIDIVQVQMLTTSYRLVYEKRAGSEAKLTVVMVFGGGTTGSIGVGTAASGAWSRISMEIENPTGSSPRLVVRVDGVQRGATGAGNLADSGGLFQIQKLVVGASTAAGSTVPLAAHLDDVTLDL